MSSRRIEPSRKICGPSLCGCMAGRRSVGAVPMPALHELVLMDRSAGFGLVSLPARASERFTDKPIWEGEEREMDERASGGGDEFTRTLIATSSVVSTCMNEHPRVARAPVGKLFPFQIDFVSRAIRKAKMQRQWLRFVTHLFSIRTQRTSTNGSSFLPAHRRTPSEQPPTPRSHRRRAPVRPPDSIVKIDVARSSFLPCRTCSCGAGQWIVSKFNLSEGNNASCMRVCNLSIALTSVPLVAAGVRGNLPRPVVLPMRFHARILRPARQTANEPRRFLGTLRRGRGILGNRAILSERIWRGKSPDSLVQQLN